MENNQNLIEWNRKLVEETIVILEDSNAKTHDAITRLRDFLNVNPGGPCIKAAGISENLTTSLTDLG